MPVWDNIIVGQPKLGPENFSVGFEDEFDILDINQSAAVGATDGKWKRGFYASNITDNGATWGSDSIYGPAQINNERQFYGDTKYAHPSNYNGVSINDSALILRSRPVDTRSWADADRARVKGFPLDASGTQGTFQQDLMVPWYGEMLTNYGRFSMSFGEFEAELQMPLGGVFDADDINDVYSIFPAWWLLQDIPYKRGVDGQLTSNQATFMPAKFNLGGVITEIDIAEVFGYEENAIHQTTHHTEEGNGSVVSNASTIQTSFNPSREFFVAGVHITPGKIGFYINGVYTKVVDTPPEIGLGMRVPTFDTGSPWQATGWSPDFQQHASGDRRYMQFCMILNIARDAKLTRDFTRIHHNGGYHVPAHADTCSMYVKYVTAKPLAVDNPDAFGMTVRGQYIPTIGAGGWAGNA